MERATTLRLLAEDAADGGSAPESASAQRSASGIQRAAKILRAGGTVAFPTETVYGLGANALDEAAVARIFAAKRRPGWDPLIVHVCDAEMLRRVIAPLQGDAAEKLRLLARAFWPGPLTLLLPKHPDVPMAVTAGRTRVGVRMPRHPVALELIRSARVPIAAPSANLFGGVSPTTAAHVLRDLDGRIDAVLDGGPTQIGVESTVLDPFPVDGSAEGMLVYRPGKVTLEEIEAVAGPVRLFAPPPAHRDDPQESQPSPGVGLRHYAPRARLILVEDRSQLNHELNKNIFSAEAVGVMLPDSWEIPIDLTHRLASRIFPWGGMADPEAQARLLFAGLRELDERGATVILCPLPSSSGLGAAIIDRLRKAARR